MLFEKMEIASILEWFNCIKEYLWWRQTKNLTDHIPSSTLHKIVKQICKTNHFKIMTGFRNREQQDDYRITCMVFKVIYCISSEICILRTNWYILSWHWHWQILIVFEPLMSSVRSPLHKPCSFRIQFSVLSTFYISSLEKFNSYEINAHLNNATECKEEIKGKD